MMIYRLLRFRVRGIGRPFEFEDVIYGLPALVLALSIGVSVIRALLAQDVALWGNSSQTTAWVGVVVMFWLLGVGTVGRLNAYEPLPGRLFLWATTLTGLITLAGSTAPWVPQASLFGSPALVLLGAVLFHFHLVFPQEVEARWLRPLLLLAYVPAGMLAMTWILRPALPGLRMISRLFFALSILAAWGRAVGVGRWWGISLEEKWIGRWLSIVLFVGGLIPTWGVLVAEMMWGRPLIPLVIAYGLELVVPFGYLVVLRRHGPWERPEPVPRWVVTVAVLLIDGLALSYLAVLGMSMTSRPVVRWGLPLVLVGAAYPLFRIVQTWITEELYGGWYRRERVLRDLSDMLARGETRENAWRRVVQRLAIGLGATWACVALGQTVCFCWDTERGMVEAPVEEPTLEIPITIKGREYGRLQLGRPLGRDVFNPWEQHWLEAIARLVGIRLAWQESEAEVTRLRAELATAHADISKKAPSPLSKREADVLELVASGLGDREIADALHLSQKTVETHLQHIYRKLGVRNRAAAVAIAVGEGWIEPPEWYRGTKGNP